MTNSGTLALLLMLVSIGLWISLPLWRKRISTGTSASQEDKLAAYYERILTNIRDLDEDHATGKMNAADYQTEREVWVQQGVQILRAVDGLQTVTGQDSDDRVEAAVASYRHKMGR